MRLVAGDVATLSIERLGKAGIHALAAAVTTLVLVPGAALARVRAGHTDLCRDPGRYDDGR